MNPAARTREDDVPDQPSDADALPPRKSDDVQHVEKLQAKADAAAWGQHLRVLRGRATQAAVGERAGCHDSYICQLELGMHYRLSAEQRLRFEAAAATANAAALRAAAYSDTEAAEAAAAAADAAAARAERQAQVAASANASAGRQSEAPAGNVGGKGGTGATPAGSGGTGGPGLSKTALSVYGPLTIGADVHFWDLLEATVTRVIRSEVRAELDRRAVETAAREGHEAREAQKPTAEI